MFDLLPLDVTLTVAQDWLDPSLVILSRLDIALCNWSMRSEWLQLASRVKVKQARTMQPIHCCLSWICDRAIHADKFVADMALINALYHTETGDIWLPATTAVEFDPKKCTGSPFGISTFLSYFPNLTALNFRDCKLKEPHLYELYRLNCPLKELRLGGIYDGISATTAVLAYEHFSSTLTMLDCDVLDDWALIQLAKCCHLLTHLLVDYTLVKNVKNIVRLCNSNPRLMSVEFLIAQYASGCLDNTAMEAICRACPELRIIKLAYNPTTTASLLPVLLETFPDLYIVSICEMKIEILKEDGEKTCRLTYADPADTAAQIHEVLRAITVPICEFGTIAIPVRVDMPMIPLLAEKLGENLKQLHITLPPNVANADVERLLKHCCRVVTALSLHAGRMAIAAETIQQLHLYCPNLRHLALVNCARTISNTDFIALVRAYSSRLLIMRFVGCPLLTDDVIPVIVELMPTVTELHLTGSKVTKEALLALVAALVPKKLTKLGVSNAAESLWMNERLKAAMKSKCLICHP